MKKIFQLIILLIGIGVFSGTLFSSEIDSFTYRYDPSLTDSTEKINAITDLYFNQAIFEANAKGSCNASVLRSKVHTIFGGHLKGKLRKYLMKTGDLDRRKGIVRHSIYQDFSNIHSWGFKGASKIYNTMGVVFKIQNYIIGSDKFAHFFNQGMRYYKKHYLKGMDPYQVAYEGLRSETLSYLGSPLTGIASFGDMAANFKGMLFWNELVGEGIDVVTHKKPTRPYVQCQNNEWVKLRKINWNEIIDASFDEGYNCNMFLSDKLVKAYQKGIKRIEQTYHQKISCPLDPQDLLKASKKFGNFAHFTINPRGNLNDNFALSPWPNDFK